MTSLVRQARSAADLSAIQRQRYDIYIKELGYPQRYADHEARTIAEPMDATACIFGAFEGDQVLGSVRVNYGDDDSLGSYAELYGLRRFAKHFPVDLSLVTKLMINPGHRSGMLMARLSIALYEHTKQFKPQVLFCVIDCIPALCPFFLRIGYRQIGAPFAHPEAATVVPMGFAVYDRAHFQRVRSPLARVCPKHDVASAEWFERHLLAGQAWHPPLPSESDTLVSRGADRHAPARAP